MRVAVIRGGPSGIVTLKYLVMAHQSLLCESVDARLFEYQPQIGGTFAARSYEDAEVSSSLKNADWIHLTLASAGVFEAAYNLLGLQTR